MNPGPPTPNPLGIRFGIVGKEAIFQKIKVLDQWCTADRERTSQSGWERQIDPPIRYWPTYIGRTCLLIINIPSACLLNKGPSSLALLANLG